MNTRLLAELCRSKLVQAMGKAKHAQGNGGEADKREDVLQAVVLADGTFSRALHPLTLERPLALVPLLGVPLLEYTLEFLAASGVGEVRRGCRWSRTLARLVTRLSPSLRRPPGVLAPPTLSLVRALSAADDSLARPPSPPPTPPRGRRASRARLAGATPRTSERQRDDSSSSIFSPRRPPPDPRARARAVLAVCGNNEVFVIACRHADKVEAYLEAEKKRGRVRVVSGGAAAGGGGKGSAAPALMDVKCLKMSHVQNPGDALREVRGERVVVQPYAAESGGAAIRHGAWCCNHTPQGLVLETYATGTGAGNRRARPVEMTCRVRIGALNHEEK